MSEAEPAAWRTGRLLETAERVRGGPRSPIVGTRLASVARAVVPPLAAFAAGRIVLLIAAWRTGFDPWQPGNYGHWDSAHYLSIAARGYELFHCSRLVPNPYDPNDWCGNTGWFPGYPYLLAPVVHAGVSGLLAGAVMSAAIALGMLVVIWIAGFNAQLTARSGLCLLLAAVFPGQAYQHALFPVGLALLGMFSMLLFLRRGHYGWAGLAGALAAFSYATPVLLAPAGALWCLMHAGGDWSSRTRRATLVAMLTLAGFALVLVIHQVTVGAWDAFFKAHHKYGLGVANPATTWQLAIEPLRQSGISKTFFPAAQTLLVSAIMFTALGALLIRHSLDPAESWSVTTAGLLWLFPLVLGTGVSLYRAEALLVPAVILLRRLPWPLIALFVTASAYLAFQMGKLFFLNVLV